MFQNRPVSIGKMFQNRPVSIGKMFQNWPVSIGKMFPKSVFFRELLTLVYLFNEMNLNGQASKRP